MQIKIKTYDELRESRVSVEVPDGQRFDIELDGEYRITNRGWADSAASSLGDRLYTSEKVGDFQASEAELVSAPLRRQVADLEKALTLTTNSREFNRKRVIELNKERHGALVQITDLKSDIQDLKTQLETAQRAREIETKRATEAEATIRIRRLEQEARERLADHSRDIQAIQDRARDMAIRLSAAQVRANDAETVIEKIKGVVNKADVSSALNHHAVPSYADCLKSAVREVRGLTSQA